MSSRLAILNIQAAKVGGVLRKEHPTFVRGERELAIILPATHASLDDSQAIEPGTPQGSDKRPVKGVLIVVEAEH